MIGDSFKRYTNKILFTMSSSNSGSGGGGGLMSSAGLVTYYDEEGARFQIDPKTVTMFAILIAIVFTTINVTMI